MRLAYSTRLNEDLARSVSSAPFTHGVVNLPALAGGIKRRNEAEKVALEDVERLVMETANLLGAAVEFDARSDYLILQRKGTMLFDGVAHPQQLAVLTAALKSYCRTARIEPGTAEYENAGWLIMSLFTSGTSSAEDLAEALNEWSSGARLTKLGVG